MNQGRNLYRTKETITDAAIRETNCKLVQPGTVLLSFKLSIGKVAVAQIPLFTNEAIAALPILEPTRLSTAYLYWALRSIDLTLGLDRAAKGLTLNKPKLLALGVPLPSVADQNRIVSVLDRIESLRTKRRGAITGLGTLSHSIFVEMFGDPLVNPMRWRTSTIGEQAIQVTDGEHVTPIRVKAGIKLLSARNVRDGYLDFTNVDFIGKEEYQRIRRRCNPTLGDVLISCSGTIGRIATVGTTEPFSLVRSVALVRPKTETVSSRFLEYYLRTPTLQARMHSRANASSQANLFQNQIRDLPLLLPPMSLQQEFGERIATLDTIQGRQNLSLSNLDELFASLEHRAFRGGL